MRGPQWPGPGERDISPDRALGPISVTAMAGGVVGDGGVLGVAT
jgi:hypothetical protein